MGSTDKLGFCKKRNKKNVKSEMSLDFGCCIQVIFCEFLVGLFTYNERQLAIFLISVISLGFMVKHQLS